MNKKKLFMNYVNMKPVVEDELFSGVVYSTSGYLPYTNGGTQPTLSKTWSTPAFTNKVVAFTQVIPEGTYNITFHYSGNTSQTFSNVVVSSGYQATSIGSWSYTTSGKTCSTSIFVNTSGVKFSGTYIKYSGQYENSSTGSFESCEYKYYANKNVTSIEVEQLQ